jgi:hypothetical protein
MLRSAVFVLLCASPLFAQENPGAPPLQYAPPYAVPPPVYVIPPPNLEAIDALEHSGRHKILAGNVLLVSGSVLAVTGTALLISGVAVEDGSCGRFYHRYYQDGYYTHCNDRNALAFAGGTTALLGVAALVPGGFIRASGARELATARQLRRGSCCAWSVRPSLSSRGASAALDIRF